MTGTLLNTQNAPTITAFGSIYVLSTLLIAGVTNFVFVPQRMFHDEPENGVRLPPAAQGVRLSVFCLSDSSEAAKVWPVEGDCAPSIDLIAPGSGVTYKAQGGGWQCQPM